MVEMKAVQRICLTLIDYSQNVQFHTLASIGTSLSIQDKRYKKVVSLVPRVQSDLE